MATPPIISPPSPAIPPISSTPPPPQPTIPILPPLLLTPSPPPPTTTTPAAPPPSTPAAPPPATPSAPPPATPSPPPPVLSPPPPLPLPSPPPPVLSSPPPPLPLPSPPPATNSPPPPVTSASPPPPSRILSSPPPPSRTSPPPRQSVVSPPPPQEVSSPPPPPTADPPKGSPPSPPLRSPPPIRSPPPPLALTASPPSPPPPLPTLPTQKPTAKSTTNNNVTASDTSNSGGGGLRTGGVIAVGVIVGFVMISLLLMVLMFTKKKRRKSRDFAYAMPSPFASSQNSDSVFIRPHSPAPLMLGSRSGGSDIHPPSEGGVNNSKTWFTYDELIQATDGFSTHNLLGEGGFGCVYKGALPDGRVVAVKQLKIGGGQGEREFGAEVEIISRVHHRHLVSLVGYCISDRQRLLVYDFVPNNTLHHHLHGEGRPVMTWGIRVKAAAGSARGIAYLHEDCHPRIIHRDIKSSNILLDNNYDAQVSDFGLAKLALDTNTHITTRVMGTFGYMAPEYATSGKLTEKSDVYSFGVVLLELITGRKPVDGSQPLGDESLVEWARPLLSEALDSENFEELVDPRLGKNYNENEMFRMIEAAAACVRHSATKRPRMGQVVRALDSLDDITDLSNGVKPGQSEVYDSARHSAQIRMFRRMAFGSQDHSTDFYERTHSSWASRDHRDQTQSSFGSRDNNSGYQGQNSLTNREKENQNTTTITTTTTTNTTPATTKNPLAGFWDN